VTRSVTNGTELIVIEPHGPNEADYRDFPMEPNISES
jgi:hypothetical protein